MKFGICTSPENAAAAREAGWDYLEGSVQSILRGTTPDDQWQPPAAPELPVRAANLLVPAALKITGPTASPGELRTYMERVTRRAKQLGINMLVFGSGGARQVPDGFDREQAKRQISEFAKVSADLAGRSGVTIVVEPLNRRECNIINSVAEAMEYVGAVNHPNLQCLLDTYHFWLEDEPVQNLVDAIGSIKHVHVADKDGRVAPGESGTADYQPVFRVLRQHGYDGMISVEALNFAPPAYFTTLEYLKGQWARSN